MARWWYDEPTATAIVETAEAIGLRWLPAAQRDPMQTSSFGAGVLIQAALDAGAQRVLICVGGSATVDGGAGCLQALGWRLFDGAGRELSAPVTGGVSPEVADVVPPAGECGRPARAELIVLTDVDNPLCGPHGAAAVFGPQKGATPAQVAQLDAALAHWADVLGRGSSVGPALRELSGSGASLHDLPGSGAAGGLAAGLVAAGARLVSGFDYVADAVGLDEQLSRCDLCLTGEGRLDAQTGRGKVVAGVAARARRLGKRVVAFVGATQGPPADLARALHLDVVVTITPPNTPLPVALAATASNLTAAARRHFAE
jgi:glycerate kinase